MSVHLTLTLKIYGCLFQELKNHHVDFGTVSVALGAESEPARQGARFGDAGGDEGIVLTVFGSAGAKGDSGLFFDFRDLG